MKKTSIIVPADIRYMSDWSEKEDGYKLEDYPFPHILDKQITGCGFTEYCLRNKLNVVLCSPRKILLENKKDQHQDEPNIVHFRWEDGATQFDRDLSATNKKPTVSGRNPLKNFLQYQEDNKEKPEIEEKSENEGKLLTMKEEVKQRIQGITGSGLPCKILVTYDSFRHVKEILKQLGLLSDFFVVIDEFQSIFTDSRFKSDAELSLLYELSDLNKLCYVSATPMMDTYLEMLDEFKDLPYYEFDWITAAPGRILKPCVKEFPCKNITTVAAKIVDTYKSGNFKKSATRDDVGNLVEVESKEAVFYINSVKNICDIIKKCKLTPENTNVLCSRTPENEQKIRRAFREVNENAVGGIGVVPKRDDPHKMFTLCTRTVYLGADFYSKCARSFIFSDANIDCLSVDITLDLSQILGRQRLDENPWKNRVDIYYRETKGEDLNEESFKEYVQMKKESSLRLLGIYNNTSEAKDRHLLALTYQNSTKFDTYKSNYISVNTHQGSDLVPVLNNLVMVSELRAFEMQQKEYRDRVAVVNTISKEYNVLQDKLESKYLEIEEESHFQDKMRLVCTTGFDENTQMALLSQIPIEFSNYYLCIGPERCRALRYRQDLLQEEYNNLFKKQSENLSVKIIERFTVGERYSMSDIKQKLIVLYEDVGLTGKPTAKLLESVFEIKTCNIPNPENPKKRDKGFEILKRKEI